MTKYRAKEDIPPGIKKGDVVDFKNPLVPAYASRFERYNEDSDEKGSDTDDDNQSNTPKTGIVNPDRNDLKKRATELGINFAQNIPTDRLIELLQEAEAKRQVGDSSEGADDDGDGGDGDDGGEE